MSQRITLRSRREHAKTDRRLVSVFTNGQLAGELLLSVGEWQIFGAAMRLGADRTNGALALAIDEIDEV